MKQLFKNAHLYDPASGLDGLGEIFVVDGRIEKISKGSAGREADEIIDLGGLQLVPGFIDIHVHFREPGDEHKETIESGSKAGAAGGFTTVCGMANTNPVNDSVFVAKFITNRAREKSVIRYHPIGAVSKNLESKEMVEFGAMIGAGCVAFSDDGRCVTDSYLARKTLEYLKDYNVPFIEHCEDCRLAMRGVMNEGRISFDMGLTGIPHASEDVIVYRDLELARLTGGHIHLAHLSSRHAVKALREGKRDGIRCTGEVTPHHLLLTEDDVKDLHTNFKMAPPLRTEEDRKALVQALNDGIIECIATDHAPHSVREKGVEFSQAANGVIGLETAWSSCMKLVLNGELKYARLIEAMTSGPADIMRFKDRGRLREGLLADFAALDLKTTWTVNPERFQSKSRNCPFNGWQLQGQVAKTFVGGRLVYDREQNR
ncbi:MAG TPA: dihydroorotase [Bdellovibrionales bacterium]|nr:dihydroorotase [Bdellovibrionales bacterium]